MDRPIFVPKCLVILSQWPFQDFFRDYLCQLVYRLQHGARLPLERYAHAVLELRLASGHPQRRASGSWGGASEARGPARSRYLVNLVYEVPLPPPGRIEVEVTLDDVKLYLSRPPLNSIGVVQNVSEPRPRSRLAPTDASVHRR